MIPHNGYDEKLNDPVLGKRMSKLFGGGDLFGIDENEEYMGEDGETENVGDKDFGTKKVFQDFGIGRNYMGSDAFKGFSSSGFGN